MKKNNKKYDENKVTNCILAVLTIILLALLIWVLIINNRKYRIAYGGNEYSCAVRSKVVKDGETFLGFSKEKYNSKEEALEACKQKEVVILSKDGTLEEYQDARNICLFKNEDEENYYFYPQDVYSYTNCIKVK